MSAACAGAVICGMCIIVAAIAGGAVLLLPAVYDNDVPAKQGMCSITVTNVTATDCNRVEYILERENCTVIRSECFDVSPTYLRGNLTCYYSGCRLQLRKFNARPSTVFYWAWGSLGVAFCAFPIVLICVYFTGLCMMAAAAKCGGSPYVPQVDV